MLLFGVFLAPDPKHTQAVTWLTNAIFVRCHPEPQILVTVDLRLYLEI